MLTRWLLVVLLSLHTRAFNLDLRYPHVYQTDMPGDYFGFSVALHPGSQAPDDPAWMMIGVSRGNRSDAPGIHEPGYVLQCPLRSPCTTMQIGKAPGKKDNLERSMMGSAQDILHGRYVTCSPRWMQEASQRYQMFGECYWDNVKSTSAPKKLQPLNNKDYLTHTAYLTGGSTSVQPFYVYGEAGFAVHIPKKLQNEENEMVIGAPGVFNWQGTTILYRSKKGFGKEPIIPNPYNTGKSSPFGLFGYAITSGRYFQRSKTLYATGAPRAHQVGQVMIYDFPEKSHQGLKVVGNVIKGLQVGEYFGSALASCDVDNDGLDDLFVGAPLHSSTLKDDRDVKDVGQVYIFKGNSEGFAEAAVSKMITGFSREGRFGATISCVGDLDHDSFEEIAIAAPYENEGVVYIFSGVGGEWRVTQRIPGSVVEPNIRGFGISISRGQDVDGNGYNDFAVGAYLSGHAVLLRSRPVVKLSASLTPMVKIDGLTRNSTNLQVSACIKYTGFRAPDSLDIVQHVDVDSRLNRVFLDINTPNAEISSHTSSFTLHGQDTDNCFPLNFIVKNKVKNYIDPVPINTKYELKRDLDEFKPILIHQEIINEDQDLFCTKCPLVKEGEKIEAETQVQFESECGSDNICNSNIAVSLKFLDMSSNGFTVGSAPSIKLRVSVINAEHSDPAYLTRVYVSLPVWASKYPSECLELEVNDVSETQLLCDVGNPLQGGREYARHIDIDLDMQSVTALHKFEVLANVTTSSKDRNKNDNLAIIHLDLSAHADITVSGKSDKEIYLFDTKDDGEGSRTREVSFVLRYQVEKFGVSPVDEIQLIVNFPIAMGSGKSFLQLSRPEFTLNSRPLRCNSTFAFASEEKIDMAPSQHIISQAGMRQKRQIIERTGKQAGQIHGGFPTNRTLFVNCSSSRWQCSEVRCLAGPFFNNQTFAKLALSMIIDTSVLERELGQRDIILYGTTAEVTIVKPHNIQQPTDGMSDRADVSATLRGQIPEARVETWVLALSVIGGVMLLMMLVTGLIKAGFFERKQKDALIKLKRETQLDLAALQAMHDMEDIDVDEDVNQDSD